MSTKKDEDDKSAVFELVRVLVMHGNEFVGMASAFGSSILIHRIYVTLFQLLRMR